MAGPADWGAVPAPIPSVAPADENNPVAWGATPPPPIWLDMAKTTGPSLARGGVAAVTGIPSITDLAAKGISAGAEKLQPTLISPETAETVKSGSEWVQKKLEPYTYGPVLKGLEENVTGKLYEPQTGAGKVWGTGLEILPSMYTGATGVIPKVAGLTSVPGHLNKWVRALMGGAGAEGLGALAENYGPEGLGAWGKAIGGVAGAAFGPAAARKAVTPFASTAEHAADVATLKDAGIKGLTAGQVSGSPKLMQLESNLSGPKLAAKDTGAFTEAAAAKAGMPGVKSLTPEAFNKAEQGFKNYNAAVRGAEIQPANFAAMHTELADIRKNAFKDLRQGGIQNIDNVIAELKGGPGALSMPGGRYQYMRQQIQGMLGDKSLTGTEKKYLSEIKTALDGAMAKELPGNLADQHKAYANFEILKNTKLDKNRQITPEALHKSISGQWGEDAYNLGRGMSGMTAAGERVLPRPERSNEPSRFIKALSTIGGAAAGHSMKTPSGQGEAFVGGILGKEISDLVQGAARVGAKPLYWNPATQGYLGNQLWKPGAATAMDPALAIRLLRGPANPIYGPPAVQGQ